MTESNISSGTVTYYTFEKPSTWKEVWKLTSMTLESEIPNQSLEFSFLQSRDGLAQAKHGTASFSLSRNNTQGENTYVIARYGHKILALTGGSIDINGITPSFGTGYDQTSVDAGKVAIKY